MPLLFNQDSVQPTSLIEGVKRQVLLDASNIGNDRITLERWAMDKGSTQTLSIPDDGFAWAQLPAGACQLSAPGIDDVIGGDDIVLFPPGLDVRFRAEQTAEVLLAKVPDAARFDRAFATSPPPYRKIDWTTQPVLNAEHDARKRIYMVSPKMFATKAFKGEMIIYPPGTHAPNHHHEGAQHFQYVLSGAGTVYLSEQPHELRAGDVLYNYEFERHYFENNTDEDFVFVEFFVPGECKTIWVPGVEPCAWVPTGKDIKGRKPVRTIKAHSSALVATPADV